MTPQQQAAMKAATDLRYATRGAERAQLIATIDSLVGFFDAAGHVRWPLRIASAADEPSRLTYQYPSLDIA